MNRFPPQGGVTPAQFIGQFPASNQIINGDFSNDLEGWIHPGSVSIESGTGLIGSKAALINPTQYTYIYNATHIDCNVGDVIYARCWFKVSQGASTLSFVVRSDIDNVTFAEETPVAYTSESDDWIGISIIGRATAPRYRVYFYVTSHTSPAPKAKVYVDGFLSLNLTNVFGKGNKFGELGKRDMDNALSKFANSYFNGTAILPLLSNKDLYRLIALERYKNNFEVIADFSGMFKALDRTYTDYNLTWESITYTDVYSLYDALETAYPTYISHTTEATITTQDLGVCEIRKYVFKPVLPVGGIDSLPKVIITAGIHGSEKMGILSLYNMMADICNNWQDDDRLCYLRYNIEFVIYPCVNVWGVNNNERKNYNGVDINRNFPINWVLGANPSAVDYGGSLALSEVEAQCVHNTTNELKETAILFLDFHNYATPIVGTDCAFISSPTQEMKLFGTNYIRNITGFWQKEYPSDILQTDIPFGHVEGGVYWNGTATSNADDIGILSTTVEVGMLFPNQTGAKDYDIVSQKRHQEFITNFVLQCLKKIMT